MAHWDKFINHVYFVYIQLTLGAKSLQITEVKERDLVFFCLPLLPSSDNHGKVQEI